VPERRKRERGKKYTKKNLRFGKSVVKLSKAVGRKAIAIQEERRGKREGKGKGGHSACEKVFVNKDGGKKKGKREKKTGGGKREMVSTSLGLPSRHC